MARFPFRRKKAATVEPARSLLLQLPAEIRMLIWEELYGHQTVHLIYIPFDDDCGVWNTSLCVSGPHAHKEGHRLGTWDKSRDGIVKNQLQCYGETRKYWSQESCHEHDNPSVDLRALRACKTLHQELEQVVYQKTIFVVTHPWSFGLFVDERTKQQLRYLRTFHFELARMGWQTRLHLWKHEFAYHRLSTLVALQTIHFHFGKGRRPDTGRNLMSLIDHWRAVNSIELDLEDKRNVHARLKPGLTKEPGDSVNELIIGQRHVLEKYGTGASVNLFAREMLIQEMLELGVEGIPAEDPANEALHTPVTDAEWHLMRGRYRLCYATYPPFLPPAPPGVTFLVAPKSFISSKMGDWRKKRRKSSHGADLQRRRSSAQ